MSSPFQACLSELSKWPSSSSKGSRGEAVPAVKWPGATEARRNSPSADRNTAARLPISWMPYTPAISQTSPTASSWWQHGWLPEEHCASRIRSSRQQIPLQCLSTNSSFPGKASVSASHLHNGEHVERPVCRHPFKPLLPPLAHLRRQQRYQLRAADAGALVVQLKCVHKGEGAAALRLSGLPCQPVGQGSQAGSRRG